MKKGQKKIQISKNFKAIDIAKAIKKQNEIRRKYGLKPLKRLQIEHFLYFLNDNRQQQKPQYINPNGGMYQ